MLVEMLFWAENIKYVLVLGKGVVFWKILVFLGIKLKTWFLTISTQTSKKIIFKWISL